MLLVGLFYLQEFCVLRTGDMEFMFHKDLSNVGSDSLPKGKQDFINLPLSF